MKIKIYTYLDVVSLILELTAHAKQTTSTAPTTDLEDVILISYTGEDFSISSLVPEGWVEVKPGQFLRMPGYDPTFLGQVAFHGATREQVAADWQLLESIGSKGITTLTWDLYRGEFDIPVAATPVLDIALTGSKSGVYFVVFTTLADEHESLHEAVNSPSENPIGGPVGTDRAQRGAAWYDNE